MAHIPRCGGVANSSISPSSTSGSASLTSVTDEGALMLPEPASSEESPVVLVPALQIASDSLAAEQSRAKKKDLGIDCEIVGVEPVPARLTPRGSIVALEPVASSAGKISSTESVGVAGLQERADHGALRLRAESAEKEVRKLRMEVKQLEGQVRKLRSDAYFQRIQKNLYAPRVATDKGQEDDCLAGAHGEHDASVETSIARALAEERAVNAEAEVLRLHTELQAARTQFVLMSEQMTSSAPPPEDSTNVDSVEYALLPCLRYVCRCLCYSLMRYFMVLCFCLRIRRRSRKNDDLETASDEMAGARIKTFCADRA